MLLRTVLLLQLLLPALTLHAQRVTGGFSAPPPPGAYIRLLETRGTSHRVIDSVAIGPDGRFVIGPAAIPGEGFYQLALGDQDRIDLILVPTEPEVNLLFDGLPLQHHVQVLTSAENQRLWRYKAASREAQTVQEAVAREKDAIDPLDHRRIMSLDSVERAALARKDAVLQAIVAEAPRSYFSRVVAASTALDREIEGGPMAVARVFDLSDPGMLRSSVYDKAVMVFLQSVNAIHEEQLANAADTLIRLASRDTACMAYMVEHLIDLFSVYGPQTVLQHIVDRYLAGEDPRIPMSSALRTKVADLLAVSIGAIGVDVDLTDTTGAKTRLSRFAEGSRYVLLFFYSSTCDHCHKQMPGVNDLYRRYGDRGLRVAGIALDDDRGEFRRNLVDRALAFPCFSEFNAWGSSVAKAYAVKATPTLILLDSDRRIVAKPYDAEALREELVRLYP
jgi:peroxiredoxin